MQDYLLELLKQCLIFKINKQCTWMSSVEEEYDIEIIRYTNLLLTKPRCTLQYDDN